ncbi:2,3-bisphosphoglycerate-independent phosphoglycerate mutase [Limibaculum sp. M0105]|uniref:2,3-bisphosphoglycerate-independent phosphoglycerate mutase n=1 Tax=Thermohalobaculum xanthum TaxID=2753746 RepID=A0A8J7SJX4_9RHOB|nr:2,3-bisphosphoglycerate-independent phosphoglycerate mutase [Thermohalobaculum xanthum]MBK0401255.1 2,3-bisphosphoglycerate-independent phosphoglycerate mutase [Thermohalobaculum xanthum]
MDRKPVILCILDGWGLSDTSPANAPVEAATPNFDRIWRDCPHTTLSASGQDVGLPAGQMGNSEVGHTNIGAGRVVWMDLPRIDRAIDDGSFAENPAFDRFAQTLQASGGAAHVIGLMSPGGVHSHQHHFARTARQLARRGLRVKLHLFLDGRDVPPKSALGQLEAFEAELGDAAEIATVTGRFYGMDRDRRWDRVEAAWAAITRGQGHRAESARAAIEAAYARGESDEFVEPTVIGRYQGAAAEGDGVVCVNFRADRAREILMALLDPEFDGFARAPLPRFAAALGMVEYSDRLNQLMDVLFPSQEIVNTLGQWAAKHGKRQFRLAETEKYPHVTFFLNGGIETPEAGEERYMAPSPKVRTYDLAPEMAAAEVTEQFVGAIRAGYDLIVVNYANPDMVGHTGSLEAAMAACEAVDRGLGAALDALAETGGAMLVTADHGNCEVMVDPETGGPHTAHTTNPVPLVLVESGGGGHGLVAGGRLADLAPTLLALMGLAQPAEMTGRSLLTGPGT